MCARRLYVALSISSAEYFGDPLANLYDSLVFVLYGSFAELNGVKSFGGQLKLQLATFSVEVEDTVTAVVKDLVCPGVWGIAGDVEEY